MESMEEPFIYFKSQSPNLIANIFGKIFLEKIFSHQRRIQIILDVEVTLCVVPDELQIILTSADLTSMGSSKASQFQHRIPIVVSIVVSIISTSFQHHIPVLVSIDIREISSNRSIAGLRIVLLNHAHTMVELISKTT